MYPSLVTDACGQHLADGTHMGGTEGATYSKDETANALCWHVCDQDDHSG